MVPSVPSPETITRARLPNDIVVLAYENRSSPSVVLSGYLWAGSISEAREKAGVAGFTAGMLLRGTETRSFGQINDALESVGARLGFGSGVHTVGFGGKALADDFGLLLDILAESLQKPAFPAEETEKLQRQILTDLERRAHDTSRMADLTFDTLLYPNHPYGQSVHGYEETVSALGREDLVGYYRDHYTPQGLVIAIVGAVAASEAVARVGQALGDWCVPGVVPNRTIPPAVQLAEPRRQAVVIEGKTQSDLVLGWPGLARNDPDFMKARLTNTILGVFGMMGRLGDNVRDRQGLAYYVYSRLEAGPGAGPWLAVAGVDPDHVERAVDGILEEVRRLRDEPLPADELADSQAFLTGSLPLQLETKEGIAGILLDMERYGLGLDYLQHYGGLVEAVTVEDVQEMACRYLDPEIYALAIAGPEDQ
jgi:zinc protease